MTKISNEHMCKTDRCKHDDKFEKALVVQQDQDEPAKCIGTKRDLPQGRRSQSEVQTETSVRGSRCRRVESGDASSERATPRVNVPRGRN